VREGGRTDYARTQQGKRRRRTLEDNEEEEEEEEEVETLRAMPVSSFTSRSAHCSRIRREFVPLSPKTLEKEKTPLALFPPPSSHACNHSDAFAM